MNFLLRPQFRVFQAMTEAVIEDTNDPSKVPLTAGWRNKNQPRVVSEVSRKRIYGRGGITAWFVKLDLAIIRESPSRWGR
ncbi:MAG: hypothetical protein BAJATHORv1_10572 [Candidatus Thorarchaeota archaeon]|nr:MAG: hypothetical protein BAJATHORv1_10572 [Candidatus Thorarchaeota archaeon]